MIKILVTITSQSAKFRNWRPPINSKQIQLSKSIYVNEDQAIKKAQNVQEFYDSIS